MNPTLYFIAMMGLFALTGESLRLSAQTPTEASPAPVTSPTMAGQEQEPVLSPQPDANPSVTLPHSSAPEIPDRDLRRADLPVLSPEAITAQLSMQKADAQMRISYLEREISREPSDETWSDKAAEQLRAAITGEMNEMEITADLPVLLSVLCRTHFCRLELAHTEAGAPSELPIGIGPRLRWSGAVLVHRPNDLTTVLYLARPGHQLPKPE